MADTPLYLQSHFREQVKDTFESGIQQTVSKFSNAGIIDTDWKANQVVYRTGAPLEFVETTGQRGGETQQGEWQAGFRSGFMRDFECGIQIDRNDAHKLYTANLPTSEIQTEMQNAWHRRMDDVFVGAASAQSLGGDRPYITAQTLPAGMTIPVTWGTVADGATPTNLTVWKIEEALQRMAVNEVDLDREMTCIAISPKMKQAWLYYAINSPNDIFAQMIGDWRMNPSAGLMGCKVIVTNRLVSQGGYLQALVFTKRAFRLPPTSYEIKIDELADKRHGLQVAAYARTGCVRRYDELVQLIWCDPTKAITA